MIYLTGDLHGDIERFKSKEFKKLKRGDTLIVCGDFGFIWDGSKKEQSTLKKLGNKKYNILFVEGTHDNLDLIAQYPEGEWSGGRVHLISGSLMHLIRGNVFTIEGKKIFAFGGGESREMDIRADEGTWWSQELPAHEEIRKVREKLLSCGELDCIVTHECGSKVRKCFDPQANHGNLMTDLFDEAAETVKFKDWYFGCYHLDKLIPPRYHAVFQKVEEL